MLKLTEKIIAERIKKEYPRGVELTYIDYNDNFNENKKKMEELANTGFIDSFYENYDNYDAEAEAIKEIMKQVFTDEEIAEINNNTDLQQAVDDTCREIDNSEPIKGLLKNTSRRFFYYDLNYYMENYDGFQNVKKEAKKIAKKLKIDYETHKTALHELTGSAGYGGDLVILFVARPLDLYGEIKKKYFKFNKGYEICVMNRGNGSGWSVELKAELTFKFIRENLHDDEGNAGYSFSGDVCGLVKWDETDFAFTDKNDTAIAVKVNKQAEAFAEQEKKYQAIFDKGGCSFGDMKYTRHRETEYINNYPCGDKCRACGTFFID